MTYSLVLRSLEPRLSRQELEEISVKVPGVARADCAFIAKDWFGIISSNLVLSDALKFQAGLRAKGCEIDVVADHEIPALHHDFRCQRIDLTGDEIILSTSMGKRYPRKRSDLVFASAGLLDQEKAGRTTEMQTEVRFTDSGAYTAQVRKSVMKFEEKRFFRIDLFFGSEPHRISLEIDKQSVCFYGERHIRIRNTLDITILMVDLQSLLPPERMNRSLRELSTSHVYPSMHAYEEELRWAFYRLGAKG
jgi:hypothetical protein